MRHALQGLRVLDMTRIFAGPWAAQMLADFGADVVKVEHPNGGDDVRRMGFPTRDLQGVETGQTSSFLAMNRNKRSVALDMSKPAGCAALKALATKADVLIENFKAGGLLKYGMAYEQVSAFHPRLIYCSITGYGQTGPSGPLPGYDPVFQAASGLLSITGTSGAGGEALVGYSVADINAGFYATIAILAALRARESVTQRGQHIDLALLDCQIAAQSHIAMNYLVSGNIPVRAGTASQVNTPWQTYRTADLPLMVAIGTDRQFAVFCEALGIAELARDPRFVTNRDRMANKSALSPSIEAALAARKAAVWVRHFNSIGISAGPVNDIAAALDDPQVHHREMVRTMPDPKGPPLRFIANPIRFSDTPVTYERVPPRLGEHGAEVLEEWLQMSPTEIAAIAAEARGSGAGDR